MTTALERETPELRDSLIWRLAEISGHPPDLLHAAMSVMGVDSASSDFNSDEKWPPIPHQLQQALATIHEQAGELRAIAAIYRSGGKVVK